MSSEGQNSTFDEPDFAFPQTVDEVATQHLDHAIASNNPTEAILALLEISKSRELINPESLPECISLVESTAERFRDSSIAGLFPLLQARLLNRYKCYNPRASSREIPLLPLPDDLSEWSWEQFDYCTDSLCISSFTGEYGERLSRCPITDYAEIIECDSLSAVFFPTLLDFVTLQVYNLTNSDEIRQMITETVSAGDSALSANSLYWALESTNDFDGLKELYEKYCGKSCSGLALCRIGELVHSAFGKRYYGSHDISLNNSMARSFKAMTNAYLQAFPTSDFSNNLRFLLESISLANSEISYKITAYTGLAIDINIKVNNVPEYKVKIYKIEDNITNDNQLSDINFDEYFSSRTPVKTIDIVKSEEIPFIAKDSLSVDLGEPGMYAVWLDYAGCNHEHRNLNLVCNYPVFPIAFRDTHRGMMVLTDPVTGKPVKNDRIDIVSDNRVVATATSKSNGIALFPETYSSDGLARLSSRITHKGGNYFYNLAANTVEDDEDLENENDNAQILTDLAIYHPGDTVRFLVITSKYLTLQRKGMVVPDIEMEVTLLNANRQPVDTIYGVTDQFGRFAGEFKLPAEGLTGRFYITAHKRNSRRDYNSSTGFMVSDYKMSDFEVVIDNPAFDTPTTGDVGISGTLMSYSGMPVSDAEVTLTLKEAYRWTSDGGNEVLGSFTTTTNAQGRYNFTIPDSVFNDPNRYKYFNATVDAVSPSGASASQSRGFSRARRYRVELDCGESCINGELPFNPVVKIYDENGETDPIPLIWKLVKFDTVVATGTDFKDIDLSSIHPGTYSFNVESVQEDAVQSAGSLITIFNKASGICPNDDNAWFDSNEIKAAPGSRIKQLMAAGSDGTTVFAFLTDDGNIIDTKVMTKSAGYHEIDFSLPRGLVAPRLILFSQRHGSIVEITKDITLIKADEPAKLVIESYRDKLIPGGEETWNISFSKNGTGMESAVILDMYNKALDNLAPHHCSPYFPAYNRIANVFCSTLYVRRDRYSYSSTISGLEYQDIDIYANYRFMDVLGSTRTGMYAEAAMLYSSSPMKQLSRSMTTDYMCSDEMEYECVSEDGIVGNAMVETDDNGERGQIEQIEQENFSYRESNVPLALWKPVLTTDGNGNLSLTFNVPNANTTWRLLASAWTKDLDKGSVVREFIASKPVMVQPNLPRFLRNGDVTSLRVTVYNNSDDDAEIETVIELFNPLNGETISTLSFRDDIVQSGNRTYSFPYSAVQDIPAVGFRARARIETADGVYSDGEQSAIPLLSNSALLVESNCFYLNPGETSFEQVLPDGRDMSLSLSFCENPAWTIVSALPGLRAEIYDYANSAAAAIFSAAVSKHIVESNPVLARTLRRWIGDPANSALVSALEKNEELKIAALTATPWVEAAESDNERMQRLALLFDEHEINASIDKGITILDKLQKADGGWAWGTWCTESSTFVTSNVLTMMAELKRAGCLPANPELHRMIERAVAYYDANADARDLLFAIIRPEFGNVPMSERADSVMNETLDHIAANWRDYTDPAKKSMCAEAAWVNGRHDLAHLIMSSVSQFAVSTPNQGIRFPSINSLADYCILLETYARISPDAPEVDALRQQLIVRKQATDWGNAVTTTEVVASILNSGTDFLAGTENGNRAHVLIDGIELEPASEIEAATGHFVMDISRYAGKTLRIQTPGTGPSYGAVFSRFSMTMTDVEAVGSDEIRIEKRMYVRKDGHWANIDSLVVGDRVKTQLVIHCDRNLDYVTVSDERAACLQPVMQLPGWVWSEGAAFYRENRDAGTNLFIERLRPGTYMLEYEFNVGQSGVYSSGVATIQSQYSPEITAHSSGNVIEVKD